MITRVSAWDRISSSRAKPCLSGREPGGDPGGNQPGNRLPSQWAIPARDSESRIGRTDCSDQPRPIMHHWNAAVDRTLAPCSRRPERIARRLALAAVRARERRSSAGDRFGPWPPTSAAWPRMRTQDCSSVRAGKRAGLPGRAASARPAQRAAAIAAADVGRCPAGSFRQVRAPSLRPCPRRMDGPVRYTYIIATPSVGM